jgi:hypothetical protein
MDNTEERLGQIEARQRQLHLTRKFVEDSLTAAETQVRHAKSNLRSIDMENGQLSAEYIKLKGW